MGLTDGRPLRGRSARCRIYRRFVGRALLAYGYWEKPPPGTPCGISFGVMCPLRVILRVQVDILRETKLGTTTALTSSAFPSQTVVHSLAFPGQAATTALFEASCSVGCPVHPSGVEAVHRCIRPRRHQLWGDVSSVPGAAFLVDTERLCRSPAPLRLSPEGASFNNLGRRGRSPMNPGWSSHAA